MRGKHVGRQRKGAAVVFLLSETAAAGGDERASGGGRMGKWAGGTGEVRGERATAHTVPVVW